jgi:hypothetical protein
MDFPVYSSAEHSPAQNGPPFPSALSILASVAAPLRRVQGRDGAGFNYEKRDRSRRWCQQAGGW